MIIKWTDEINSFDKRTFIHKEKQRGCPLLDQQICVYQMNLFHRSIL